MTTENEKRVAILRVCDTCRYAEGPWDAVAGTHNRHPVLGPAANICPGKVSSIPYVPKQELTQAEETIVALRREAGTHGRDAAKMIEDAYKSGREEERAYREALDSSTGSR